MLNMNSLGFTVSDIKMSKKLTYYKFYKLKSLRVGRFLAKGHTKALEGERSVGNATSKYQSLWLRRLVEIFQRRFYE